MLPMNRKQRRAGKKGKKGNGSDGLSGDHPNMTFRKNEKGKTVISIPVSTSAQNKIEDREQYLKDFERSRELLEKDELAEATQLLNKLLKQNTRDHGVYELLGIASEKLKNYHAAIKFFKAAKELQPEKYSLDVCVANLLIKIDDIEEGLDLAEFCIANHLDSLNQSEQAASYGIAGHAYMLMGDKDKAKPYLRKACEIDPDNLEHLYNYVSQAGKPQSKDDPFFKKLKELEELDDSTRTDQENALLYYGLFDCYDAVKDHETAFDYALAGARHKRKTTNHDPELINKVFEGVKAYFNEDFSNAVSEPSYDTEAPVFIVGMPRSGTTLLEQILQSHPDVAGVGEDALIGYLIKHYSLLPPNKETLYPLRYTTEIQGYYTPEVIGRKYGEYIAEKHPTAKRVINKAIGNMLWLGYLSIALPKAKFIHIKRNAMDGCLSTFTKNFIDTAQAYSYKLEELGEYYKNYVELMEHWNALLPDRILNIEYEQIVDNLEEKAREVIDFIGLPWDDRCLEFHKTESVVRTASVSQVRKPIYKTSVDRWKKYGPKITPLIKALDHAAPKEAKKYMQDIEEKNGK